MTDETTAPRRGRPPKAEGDKQTIDVLMLRGYVPKDAQVLSTDAATGKDATLLKVTKGQIVELPATEAKDLMRRGIAVRPDEATDNHLIQAGLKAPPQIDEDEEF